MVKTPNDEIPRSRCCFLHFTPGGLFASGAGAARRRPAGPAGSAAGRGPRRPWPSVAKRNDLLRHQRRHRQRWRSRRPRRSRRTLPGWPLPSARAITPGALTSARRPAPASPRSTRATASAPGPGTTIPTHSSASHRTRLFPQDLGELHGDTLIQAQRGSNLFKQSARNEHGEVINGVGDPPPNQHDILTGSQTDGRAFTDTADHTCNNWTSSTTGSAQVGHSDRIGNNNHSWNSSHATTRLQPGRARKHRRRRPVLLFRDQLSAWVV